MRIDTLHLEQFRCFEKLDLELHPEFTLLTGINGSGKTAILDALAVAAGSWMLGVPDIPTRNIAAEDRRLVKVEHDGVPSLELAGTTIVRAHGEIDGRQVGWARELPARGTTTRARAYPLRDIAAGKVSRLARGTPTDLPVIAYYGTGRLWVQQRARTDREDRLGSVTQGYEACLDPASDHKLFEAWVRWREEVRLQKIAEAVEEGRTPDPIAAPALRAVLETGATAVDGARRFYYSVNHKELRLDLEDGRTLPFDRLSDGYRNLIAMVADIAWRAVRLNPHHGGDAPARAGGIVLIDEIDLHLHPAWQRTVIGTLRDAFPNLQFVATTHSPQVLSTADAAWIRRLDADGMISSAAHVRGRDSNSLLEDVFGVPERPQQVRDDLRKVFDALDRGEIDDAEALLTPLRALLGSDDPDVVRAETEIQLERSAGS